MLLDSVIEDVRGGQDLSARRSRSYPKVFTDIYVCMIRAGEASGQIDDILMRLADYMEASQKLKRDIKCAMTYPVVSLVMILGITAFLMLGIVPKFKEVFASLEVELPGLTKAILRFSDFCQEQWGLILVGHVLVVVLLKIYKKHREGRAAVGLADAARARLRAAVPQGRPLPVLQDLLHHDQVRRADPRRPRDRRRHVRQPSSPMRSTTPRENVRRGETLAEPLADSGVFPPMVTRMISIGEKSGSLEMLLEKISEFYDEQVHATVKQLTSLIEPIMIAIMGILVGTICSPSSCRSSSCRSSWRTDRLRTVQNACRERCRGRVDSPAAEERLAEAPSRPSRVLLYASS